MPDGNRKTTTLAGAPRAEGFAAPLALDGATDGAGFLAFAGPFAAPRGLRDRDAR